MKTRNIEPIDNAIFKTELEIRISDINYGNHLGHDSLISLIHEARVQFFKSYGYTELDICGLGILIVNINVNYLAEAFYPDKLIINIGMGEKSKSSIELLYQVNSKNQNKEIARASTIIVFYDYSKRKAARIPDEFIQKLN